MEPYTTTKEVMTNNIDRGYQVGSFIRKKIAKSIIGMVRYPERIIMIQLKSQNPEYAPTCDKPDHEIEEFYNDLKLVFKKNKILW